MTAFAALALPFLVLVRHGANGRGAVYVFVVCVLVALSRIDLDRRIIPNRIVLPAFAIVLVAQMLVAPDRALEWTISPFAAALVLLLPGVVSPNAIGMGDVKLGLLLGATLGANVVTALVVGFLLVFPVALWMVARHGIAAEGETIPLGPFLAAGAVTALLLA